MSLGLSRPECHAYGCYGFENGVVGNAQTCLKTDGLDKGTGDLNLVHIMHAADWQATLNAMEALL